jgi:Uma2 family endonuclease
MSYEILIQQGFWMHLSKEAISNPLCFTTSPEEPIELIRGELIQMAAKGMAHETCVRRLLRQLPLLIQNRATLQCQAPISLSFDGEPEPDFAIVHNRPDDYATGYPTPNDTLLVIEVADSSLDYDREVKLPLYAEAKISDYWLFEHLPDHYLEAYSEPYQIAPSKFGYLNRKIIPTTGVVALPAFPEQVLELASVFPDG